MGGKSPRGGFTRGCGKEEERGQNHRNSISRSGGDDPTFRESLRIRALEIGCPHSTPTSWPPHTQQGASGRACAHGGAAPEKG